MAEQTCERQEFTPIAKEMSMLTVDDNAHDRNSGVLSIGKIYLCITSANLNFARRERWCSM